MIDNPSIYINESTPGFTTAKVYPGGLSFNVIFDRPAENDLDRPGVVCDESDAEGINSRETVLEIDGLQYRVMGKPHRDGMGLATISLQVI